MDVARPRSPTRLRWLCAALLAAALGFVAHAVWGQSLETREQELEEIREQISKLRSSLDSMRSREATLEDQLERVGTELQLQQARFDEATAALDLASARAADAETRVGELEVALGEVRGDLRRRLAGLYRLGRQGYLRLFLALDTGQDLLPAIRQLRFLVLRDRKDLDRFTELRESLAGERARLVAELEEVAQWRGQEAQRRDDLVAAKRRHQGVLDRVTRERRRLAEEASALEDKERKLTRFVETLVADEGSASLDGTPIQDFRGVLDWPAVGDVTLEFGPRTDPRYRTQVPHNGLDLATQAGDKVRVVFPGEVLYASTFEGYGTMVVVHHPGRVFTLYAGLDLLNVGKGDVLALGDVIGVATDVLYFEIRIENQPQNPREWLR
ncbi:MAG: peptidoglycan DD-metalloendopeptidase family protein [Acidobacteriota bacterium]